MKKYSIILAGFFLCFLYTSAFSRSILRPNHTKIPLLIAHTPDNQIQYQIRDSHIEAHPLFVAYNPERFQQHMLAEDAIHFRYAPDQSVTGAHLSSLIEELIDEISAGKKRYRDFTVLQDKDFNYKMSVGLLVLAFKEYPFVLKLFLETPESFVNPWCKGFDQIWFFYMAGGISRHITGLTRIENLTHIRKKIAENPIWQSCIDTPRKWFWLPKNCPMIHLVGKNIDPTGDLHAVIPGTYAIVADRIKKVSRPTLFDPQLRKIALDLCNLLDLYIDPHIDNFFIEENSNKLVIIDTEHFPTLVGLKEPQTYTSYTGWYLGLTKKATHDIFFRPKYERRSAQAKRSRLTLFTDPIPAATL